MLCFCNFIIFICYEFIPFYQVKPPQQATGFLTLAAFYTPFRSMLNVCHRHTAPPNGHASMSAWLVARGNKYSQSALFTAYVSITASQKVSSNLYGFAAQKKKGLRPIPFALVGSPGPVFKSFPVYPYRKPGARLSGAWKFSCRIRNCFQSFRETGIPSP